MTTAVDPSGVRSAARQLAQMPTAGKNAILAAFANELHAATDTLLAANAEDVAAAKDKGVTSAIIDRLTLNLARIDDIIGALETIIELPDPVGDVFEERTLDNGLRLQKVHVPFGVVCIVYEARPNVTADAAAIAIKTGNGAILRGSSTAKHTNSAIMDCLHAAMRSVGVDTASVALFDPADRDGFTALIGDENSADLVIPRGGEGLKKFLYEHSRIPVLAAAGGNCHVYVDAEADLAMAKAIVLNAKTQRTGVCNAIETLLVHKDIAPTFLPDILEAFGEREVEVLYGNEANATEFLDMKIAVAEVGSVDEAIEHINHYGTKHSEAIVTANEETAQRFFDGVDAACIYHNASTRFTDGGVFGLGAEVGISTNKLHARGPIGLRELTTYTYHIRGNGQIRT